MRVLFGVYIGHVSLLIDVIRLDVESHVRACGCVVTDLLRGSSLEFCCSHRGQYCAYFSFYIRKTRLYPAWDSLESTTEHNILVEIMLSCLNTSG